MHVVWWGTYDLGKPRSRILLRGLRSNGAQVSECHSDVWAGIEDKSQVTNWGARLALLLKWAAAYPGLVLRYLRLPSHDVVFVGYLGHLDVLVLWPWARLRKVPIVWDAFISLYDTVVADRKLVPPSHILAGFLYAWEWLACRAADWIFVENRELESYMRSLHRLPSAKVKSVFIGVEPEIFPPRARSAASADGPAMVLFFGQLIPLHGVETFLKAAALTEGEPIQWTLIGRGQQQDVVLSAKTGDALKNLTWVKWVPYKDLVAWVQRADVCVGILGDTAKAARVIPNKIFQVLACGAPLITRDSPAVRELLHPDMEGVALVPPNDPEALVNAVRQMVEESPRWRDRPLHRELMESISPDGIGRRVLAQLRDWLAERVR